MADTLKPLENTDQDNEINIHSKIKIKGWISGKNNKVIIEEPSRETDLYIHIHGNNNIITIGKQSLLNGLRIEVGSKKYSSSKVSLNIGAGFSIASKGRFLLPNDGNQLLIGENCMFSNNVIIRGGEYPHLIFDLESGEYLDKSDGIEIGNRVWVGEGAYINKSVRLENGSIVGARSVVTKRFNEENCVVAGNPAKIVKSGVQWVNNKKSLSKDSVMYQSLMNEKAKRLN